MHPLIATFNAEVDQALANYTPKERNSARKFHRKARVAFRAFWRKQDPHELTVLEALGVDCWPYMHRLLRPIEMAGFPELMYHRGIRHPERNGYYVRVAAWPKQHVSDTSASGYSVIFPRTWARVNSITDLLDKEKVFTTMIALEQHLGFETLSTWEDEAHTRLIPSPQRWWNEKDGPGWFDPGIFA